MAHYDEQFPEDIGFGSSETIVFAAEIFQSASGQSLTTSYWEDALRTWNVATGIHTAEAFERFLDFWHAFRGPEDTFLFKSPFDYSSTTPGTAIAQTDQTIESAASAGQATVQLIKTRTSGAASKSYNIYHPDTSTLLVEVNAVLKTFGVDYTESDGLLTFSPTLSLNDVVKAGYEFSWKAQFGSSNFAVQAPDKQGGGTFFLQGNIAVLQVRE